MWGPEQGASMFYQASQHQQDNLSVQNQSQDSSPSVVEHGSVGFGGAVFPTPHRPLFPTMSLQVKFPYSRGSHAPLLSCTKCSFSTRHRVLFDRHQKRCNGSKKSSKAGGIGKLPAPPVCRNYRCEKCNYTSNKAKVFLHHKKHIHGENITIYVCNKCEYASKHKNKVFRHRRLVHKDPLPIDDIGTLDDDVEIESEALGEFPVEEEQAHYDGSAEGEEVDMDPTCYGEDDQYNFVEDEEVSFRVPLDQNQNEDMENIPYKDDEVADKVQDYIAWKDDNGERPMVVCKVCGYANSVRWKVASHVQNTHLNKKVFKCNQCDFVCHRKIEWCVHRTSHTKQRVHTCKECSYKTTMKRNMERHTARHRQNGPYKCSYCSYSSTGEAVIQRHMAEYHSRTSDDKPVTATVTKPITHIKRSQTARKSGQPISSVVFDSRHPYAAPSVHTPRADAVASKSGSPEVTCDLCGLVVKTESRLRIHMVSHSNLAAWTCPLCPLRYKRPADLNRHMKRKHGVRLSDYKQSKSEEEQDKPLDLCVKREADWDEGYFLAQGGQAPLDLSHTSKCTFCPFKSNDNNVLRKHMLAHSSDKHFKCQYCGQHYKYQVDLTEHLRKYHKVSTSHLAGISVGSVVPCDDIPELNNNVKPDMESVIGDSEYDSLEGEEDNTMQNSDLKCRFCSYVGKYRKETEKHMRLHTGEKPYQCMFCLYRTIWKGDMKRHLPKHHSDEVLKHGDLQELLEKTWNPWPESLRRTADSGSMDEQDGENSVEFPDPMASLAALVDGGLEDSQGDIQPEENNNEAPLKSKFESCYLGGSWEVSEAPSSEDRSSVSPSKPEEVASASGGKTREECHICGHVTYPAAMRQHMEKHSNLRRFMCPDCGKRSNWAWDIKKHIMEAHGGDKNSLVELSEQEAKETLEAYLSTHVTRSFSKSLSRNTPDKDSIASDREGSPSFMKKRSPSPEKVIKTLNQGSFPLRKDRYRKFKCSICGKRSNWRWDLNKHIRALHPGAKIIELSDEEAKATYHEVLERQKAPSPIRPVNPVRAEPTIVKDISLVEDKSLVEDPSVGEDPSPVEDTSPVRENGVDIEGDGKELSLTARQDKLSLRRFKCSACGFRSNFRNSLLRHKRTKHPNTKARMIILSTKTALMDREHKRRVIKLTRPKPIIKNVVGSEMPSLWQCKECGFADEVKAVMLNHLRKMHPNALLLTCKLCRHSTGYRSAIYMHLRCVHGKTDVKPYVLVTSIVKANPNGEDEILTLENEGRNKDQFSPVKTSPNATTSVTTTTVYVCKNCGIDSSAKEAILDHIKTEHSGEENPEEMVRELERSFQSDDSYEIVRKKRPRSPGVIRQGVLQCDVCPYRINKQGLLKIHKQSHQKHPGKPFKCKYCPYYVSVARLLTQHHRLHWQEMGIRDTTRSPIRMTIKKKPKLSNSEENLDGSYTKVKTKSAKYMCDKCPFVGDGMKRFLYHKQLHRPRPNVAKKCAFCPFWSVSKPFLARHERLHSEEYIRAHRPDLMRTPVKQMADNMKVPFSSLPTVEVSPCKSDIHEDMTVDDVVEMASIKQQLIASKIASVPITPSKMNQTSSNGMPAKAFMPSVVIGDKGDILSAGPYRKLHKCKHCPYTNVRAASLLLHEKMHKERPADDGKEYFKCMYCTYTVGNKGLLSLHMKVHSLQYKPGVEEINDVEAEDDEPAAKPVQDEDSNDESDEDDDGSNKSPKVVQFPEKPTYPPDLSTHYEMNKLPLKTEYYVKYNDQTGEHVLERAVYKKWCCEKCPYATMKKSQFEKHALLHGSAQKYTCEYCDYSVPGFHLLLQHKRLHLEPNPNLLSVQSIANLQRLPVIPADVAAAGNYAQEVGNRENRDGRPLTHHETMELYENSPEFMEPKKLYRCDRCPYTNTRRDHLLSHLKFHVMKSDLKCPFCDYSVSKVHLLNQHIKVHFNTPGTEMNSGASKTQKEETNDDAIPKCAPAEMQQPEFLSSLELTTVTNVKKVEDPSKMEVDNDGSENQGQSKATTEMEEEAMDLSMKGSHKEGISLPCEECRYCNREFADVDVLRRHEAQHLMGMPFKV